MTAQIVFALYRPHAGQDAALRRLIARHVPALRRLGLVTARPPVLARAGDGTYVEIFEWVSETAARAAHDHAEIAEIWDAMEQIADFAALASLAEAQRPFTHFEPVALSEAQ
ncbi:MAG TPA: hypothetical protein VHZ26_10040 [Caulobacteraceae bacterium]|jgi:hypothetical protein|nr:hypothetical protein [Caulobacteraceae bacterium]